MKYTKDNLPDDFEELVYELASCDGIGSAITINDRDLGDLLIAKGLAYRNSRHSYGGTDLLRNIRRMPDYEFEIIIKHLFD